MVPGDVITLTVSNGTALTLDSCDGYIFYYYKLIFNNYNNDI